MKKQDKSGLLGSASGPAGNKSPSPVQNSSQDDRECEAIASSCGDGKGCGPEMAHPLRLQCCDCEGLVHQLSNVITPILMHAQMLEWKLPPYSHLKRPVRELERNARRAGELLKALMRLAGEGSPGVAGRLAPHPASARRVMKASGRLTSECDLRTSEVFPKRDDGN